MSAKKRKAAEIAQQKQQQGQQVQTQYLIRSLTTQRNAAQDQVAMLAARCDGLQADLAKSRARVAELEKGAKK